MAEVLAATARAGYTGFSTVEWKADHVGSSDYQVGGHLDDEGDAELRRLAALYDFGTPGAGVASRISELRAQDRRSKVRTLRSNDANVTPPPTSR